MTSRHRQIATHLPALLAEAELPAPGDVGYEPESVVFYWYEAKLAVYVDFEGDGD